MYKHAKSCSKLIKYWYQENRKLGKWKNVLTCIFPHEKNIIRKHGKLKLQNSK